MYIPRHNAFFFHTPKTGGTSVEIFFLNDDGIPVDHHELSQKLTSEQKSKYIISKKVKEFQYESQHITCECAIKMELWKNIQYSFTFVRNPWDRFVSEYHWLHQRMKKKYTIDQVIQMYISEKSSHFIPQWKYAYSGNTKIVDDIFQLENIEYAEKTLSNKLGVDVQFKSYNKTKRAAGYKDFFTGDMRKRLESVFEKDMDLFGYEY